MGIVDRLLGNLNPTLPGPLNDLPAPIKLAISNAGPWALRTNPVMRGVLDRGMETSAQAGKDIVGELALLAALGQVGAANGTSAGWNSFPWLAAQQDDPNTIAARRMLEAGPLHPGRVFDQLSEGDKKLKAIGAVGAVALDPSNYILPAGAEFARGAEYTRLAAALDDVNRMQNLPVEGLAQGIRQLRNRQLLRQVGALAGTETPDLIAAARAGDGAALDQLRQRIEDVAGDAAGNVPRGVLPPMGEGRGLGPPQNPPRRVPGDQGGQLRRQLLTPLDAPDNAPLRPREFVGHLPTLPDAAFNTRVGGRRGNGVGDRGPLLPPELGPLLPPEYGPTFPDLGPAGPLLPPVVGPPRPGRRAIPETELPISLSTLLTPPPLPDVLRREPSFAYGPPTNLQEAAQRLGIRPRPSQAPNTAAELLDAARGMVKPLTPPPSLRGAVDAPTGTLDDLRALVQSGDNGKMLGTLPGAEFFAKRLGVDVHQARAMLDQLVQDGTLGKLPDGELAVKPRDLLPTDAITPAQERAARLANEDALVGAPSMPQAPDFPHFATRAEGLASLSPGEIDTLVNLAYPGEQAQANAIAKYRNPADLASRAIERITTTPGQTEELARMSPALAQKIARLPEPTGAALPDMANVDIPVAVSGPWDQPLDQLLTEGAYRAVHLPSPKTPVEAGRTYYHVVPESYQSGDPILSAVELQRRRGIKVQDKWGEDYPNYLKSLDAKSVSLAETYAEAVDYLHSFLNGKGRILAIEVPKGTKLARNGEGYPIVNKLVPASWAHEVPTPPEMATVKFGQAPVLPKPPAGDIAAGGGGGGGLGLLPYPGGLTGPIGRAIVPAAGAGAGAGIGYLTGDNPEDARANALKGAAIGGALGLGAEYSPELAAAAGRIVTPGSTWHSLGTAAARNARTAQSEANALSLTQAPLPTGVRDWLGLWKRQVVETPRNWLQDESWGRLVLRALQPGGTPALNPLRQDAARYLTGTTAWEKLPVSTRGILTDLGQANYVPALGESLSQELRHGKQLSTVQQATGGAALSLLNPVGIATNPLGVAAAGVTGAARPALSAIFRTINDFQHSTFRLAAFNDELTTLVGGGAEDFLSRLTKQGVDVSSLPTSGGFSPAQVGSLAGPAAERQWAAITNRAVTLAEQRVKFLFGDFGKKNALEAVLGGAVPFLSWVTRAYPVAVRMALDHPVVALAVYQYYRATSQGAGQDGRPGYTTGMVPIPTSTPFVGPVLAALVPGQQGVVYVDPVGAFSPVGADLFFGNGEDATDPDKTWYQKATATLSRLGLPGPNPLIQAGAYVTGLDYKTPGALSRTAGLEQGLALVPGNPQLPNVGASLLAGARAKVSDAIGPALGGKADKWALPYDPISRRYGELVYERTGHALQDPMNRAYLVAMTDPENPLLQQARQDVLLSGAVKNAVSLVNPAQLVAQGQTPKDYQAARGAVPFSDERIANAVPALATAMQEKNARYQTTTPVLGVYQGTKPYQREDLLQAQWADQPDTKYMQRVLPKSYALQKKQQELELWTYDHRALKRSNPAEYQRQYTNKVKELGLD